MCISILLSTYIYIYIYIFIYTYIYTYIHIHIHTQYGDTFLAIDIDVTYIYNDANHEFFSDWTRVTGSDPHAPAGAVDQPGAPGDHLLLEGLFASAHNMDMWRLSDHHFSSLDCAASVARRYEQTLVVRHTQFELRGRLADII